MKSIKYILVVCVVFGFYLYTAYPTIPPYRDSGDLIAASHTLGIAHSPGYPLYTLLGKIFVTIIGFGNIAYRINLMSIISTVLTVAIIMYLFKSALAGLIVSMIFISSKAMWSLAHVSEMYTMSVLFTALLFLIIKNRPLTLKQLYLFSFVFGLGIGVHPTLVLLLPGFILWFWCNIKDKISLRDCITTLLFFAVGFSAHLYLPIRSLQNPLLDWGNPESLRNFVRIVTRAEHGGLKLHPAESKFVWTAGSLIQHSLLFIKALIGEFTFIGLTAGLIGFYYSYRRKNLNIILPGFILTGVGFFILANLPPENPTTLPILEPHLVLPGFLFVLSIGYTFSAVSKGKLRILTFIIGLVFLWNLLTNFREENCRTHYFAYDYGKNLMRTIKPDSIIYDPDDPTTFILTYLKYCENKRDDIKIGAFFRTRWGYEKLALLYPEMLPDREISSAGELVHTIFEYNIGKRNIYTDINTKISLPYHTSSNGILYRVKKKRIKSDLEYGKHYWGFYINRGVYNTSMYDDFFTQRIFYYYSSALNNLGLEYDTLRLHHRAQNYYKSALAVDPSLVEAYNNMGTSVYAQKKYDKAIQYFKKALKLKPEDTGILCNLGLSYKKTGKDSLAEKFFTETINKGHHPQAKNELGLIALSKNEVKKAISIFKDLLNHSPDYYFAYYNLGLTYQHSGNLSDARKSYKKYLQYVRDPQERKEVELIIKKLSEK
jgi:Tfp pilus assembly protein PilF